MRTTIIIAAGAAGILAACGSDSDGGTTTGGPRITLVGAGGAGADSFNQPGTHAGQEIRAALLRDSDGALLDVQKGTVAATGSPAFSLTFAPVVVTSVAHTIRYWADHNSNQVCDAAPDDHQWEVAVPAGQTAVNVVHTAVFTDACSTLTFPLTFVGIGGAGADSFNGPHADQTFRAGLVRGAAVATLDPVTAGSVAAAAVNPAFVVSFAARLFVGDAYSVKLMADHSSNGACDAPPTDHVWSVDIPTGPTTFQTTFNYPHNTNFTNACSFLPP